MSPCDARTPRDVAHSCTGGMNNMDTNLEQIKIPVCLTVPKQYVDFWEELRRIYGLPEEALDLLVSNTLIADLNSLHETLQSIEILAPNEIRKALSLKVDINLPSE
ncbi:MAG: hypothetical protein PHU34_09385 [Candidatus Methanoperedens sp.]|nr:hypothetical protein [Candidatus Methanoperedens sp.]